MAPGKNKVKATRGVLIQADESVMAIIYALDKQEGGRLVLDALDPETCLVKQEQLESLERKVKEVS